MADKPFTYEHWEAQDEYIILHHGPIGYTLSKHDAVIITNWLNSAYPDIIKRTPSKEEDEEKWKWW